MGFVRGNKSRTFYYGCDFNIEDIDYEYGVYEHGPCEHHARPCVLFDRDMGRKVTESIEIVSYNFLRFMIRVRLRRHVDDVGIDGEYACGGHARHGWRQFVLVAWFDWNTGVVADVGACLMGRVDVLEGQFEGETELQQVQRFRVGVLAYPLRTGYCDGHVALSRAERAWAACGPRGNVGFSTCASAATPLDRPCGSGGLRRCGKSSRDGGKRRTTIFLFPPFYLSLFVFRRGVLEQSRKS